MKKLGIYIHIPFCESKCYYCDFNSGKASQEEKEEYVELLLREIDLYEEGLKVDTIFIGGGTPSSIDSKYIVEILAKIHDKFDTTNLSEVTIECNPGTLDEHKVDDYVKAGINRVSLGLQTKEDDQLAKIGRIHSYGDFLKSVKLLKAGGIDNISVDLMIGLPSQNKVQLEDTIDQINKLDLSHVSMYSLKVEEGTPFEKMYDKGILILPTEEEEREIYHAALERLKKYGYNQYEISNFSKEGKESKHNLIYWEIDDYLGFGLGSSGYIDGKRYNNHYHMKEYRESIMKGQKPIEEYEVIDDKERLYEAIILGLRLNKGIDPKILKEKTGLDMEVIYKEAIDKNLESGLLLKKGDKYKLSSRGLDISNQVFVDFTEIE